MVNNSTMINNNIVNMSTDLTNNISNHLGILNSNFQNIENFTPNSLVSGDSTITSEELIDQIDHLPNVAMRPCLNKLFQEK